MLDRLGQELDLLRGQLAAVRGFDGAAQEPDEPAPADDGERAGP